MAMGSDSTVTPEEAARSLSEVLQHEPWFQTVGLGQDATGAPALFLYTKSVRAARLRQLKEWKGYPIYSKALTARPARLPQMSSTDTLASRHKDVRVSMPSAPVPAVAWTNVSVRKLLEAIGGTDPVHAITHRAREVALDAMDHGWTGPPFDPLELADHLRIDVSPRFDIPDARTVPTSGGRLRIEFNPSRPSARVRFSIAHEIAHSLFPDCGDRVRHRSPHTELREDQWQLEAMCNVGAAELLMPLGSMKAAADDDLAIEDLLVLRKRFHVSMEALFIRIVRLARTPLRMFCASRMESGGYEGRFVLNYTIGSAAWRSEFDRAAAPPEDSVLSECTAIGYTTTAVETWGGARVRLEAVAIPPYPGSRFPRVVGVLKPRASVGKAPVFRFVRGDALKPRGGRRRILVHIVNDKTPNWGGGGFAEAVGRRWPKVQCDFREVVGRDRRALTLGRVRIVAATEGTFVASVVAQKGYGESARPRVRYTALRKGLEVVAAAAKSHEATIHMPRIGVGQGGGSWSVVEDIVRSVLVEQGLSVTVYDRPGAPRPERLPLQEELSFCKHP